MDSMIPENENITAQKIEVDEKTAEPVIVETSIKEIPEHVENADVTLDNAESETESEKPKKKKKSIGKQLSMTAFGGFQRDNEISKRQKTFKLILTIVFAIFVVGVLAVTFYHDFFSTKEHLSFNELISIVGDNWYYIIFAVLSLFLLYFFKGLKLSILCKNMTGKWHMKACMSTAIVGVYYNNVTPLAVGGQPFEIYNLSKRGVSAGCATSAPIATFFLNQLAFALLALTSVILFKYNALQLPEYIVNAPALTGVVVVSCIGIGCCLVVPTLVVLFSLFPSVGTKLVNFVMHLGGKLKIVKKPKETTFKTIKTVVQNSRCLKRIAKSPLTFISNFLLSFLEQLANCSIAYFTLKFFGFDWPSWNVWEWSQIIMLCFILNAAITFIPTPGNSGAADLSFYFLFETGLAQGLAFPAMLVWRILNFYSTIVIGFAFTSIQSKREKHLAAKQEQLQAETPPSE